jgi:hypothetical protein
VGIKKTHLLTSFYEVLGIYLFNNYLILINTGISGPVGFGNRTIFPVPDPRQTVYKKFYKSFKSTDAAILCTYKNYLFVSCSCCMVGSGMS